MPTGWVNRCQPAYRRHHGDRHLASGLQAPVGWCRFRVLETDLYGSFLPGTQQADGLLELLHGRSWNHTSRCYPNDPSLRLPERDAMVAMGDDDHGDLDAISPAAHEGRRRWTPWVTIRQCRDDLRRPGHATLMRSPDEAELEIHSDQPSRGRCRSQPDGQNQRRAGQTKRPSTCPAQLAARWIVPIWPAKGADVTQYVMVEASVN